MNKQLLGIIAAKLPKINPILANGAAVQFMNEVEPHVDRDLRVSSEQLPEGLHYETYEVCTPTEEYFEIMRKREKIVVELSRSDIYMIKLKYTNNGDPLPDSYLYLPFCGEAGVMYIRGTPYGVSPVLADVAVSVTSDGLFIPLAMAKAQFERFTYHYKLGHEAQSARVVHSHLYRRSKTSKAVKIGKYSPRSNMMHYLLCKYGFSETMRRYFGVDEVLVGTKSTILNQIRVRGGLPESNEQFAQSNEESRLFDEWVICSTITDANNKPIAAKGKNYVPSEIAVAIPRGVLELDKAVAINDAMASLFYVIDVLPMRVSVKYFDDPAMWQSIMGIVLFGEGSNITEGERLTLISTHMDSLEAYVNHQSKRNLSQGGVNVDTIHDLFAWVMYQLPEMVLNANTTVASMYGKRLMVTRYILSDISSAIYLLMFKLRARAVKKGRLSVKEIVDGMRRGLHRDTITSVTSRHSEVTSISSPGDNKIFKITKNLVLQESTDSNKARGGGGSLNDPAKFLHASILRVASVAAMAKNEPTGRGQLNMMLKISARGDVMNDPETDELLEYLQSLIKR